MHIFIIKMRKFSPKNRLRMETQLVDEIEKQNDGKNRRKRKREARKPTKDDEGKADPDDGKKSSKKAAQMDFFSAHFCDEQLEDQLLLNRLQSGPGYAQRDVLPCLPDGLEKHTGTVTGWGHSTTQQIESTDQQNCLSLDEGITFKRLLRLFRQLPELKGSPEMMAAQEGLYHFIGRYMDCCCASRTLDFTPLICLHTLNHVMRTRNLVIANKQKLQRAKGQNQLNDALIEQCRDQGLSRPKVLLLCPFRKFAHRLVCTLQALMFAPGEKPFVQNWQRFEDEFGDADGNRVHEKRQVAQEFKDLMSGNVDDCFRLGIGLAKKCLKLYTSMDESDILLCSPLGLKMLIGGDGEDEGEKAKKKRSDESGGTHDFLASIELLIIDRAEVLLMQNWEHLMTVLASVNGIPVKIGTDITRVRQWSLRPGMAKHFRQTLLFSRINFVEMHALFAQNCANYAGQLSLVQDQPAEQLPIKQILSPNVQHFHRFQAESPEQQADARFKHFTREMLPKCDPGTLIFVSSYFDFVRLRNYLKRQAESFVQLHEYAEAGSVAKARQLFVRGDRKLMLLTERFHFFFRYRIKGARTLLFYQLPVNPEFYPELVDMAATLGAGEGNRLDCRLMFCRFDVLRMQNIFGQEATAQLLNGEESTPQTLMMN